MAKSTRHTCQDSQSYFVRSFVCNTAATASFTRRAFVLTRWCPPPDSRNDIHRWDPLLSRPKRDSAFPYLFNTVHLFDQHSATIPKKIALTA